MITTAQLASGQRSSRNGLTPDEWPCHEAQICTRAYLRHFAYPQAAEREGGFTLGHEREASFTLALPNATLALSTKGLAEDQPRRRHARASSDQHMLDVGHRVHRGAAQL